MAAARIFALVERNRLYTRSAKPCLAVLAATHIPSGNKLGALQDRAPPASSVVQCGQRVALIGIVIAHAGHSFETGSFSVGRFILLIPRTSRKTAKATIAKLITRVMKLP